MQFNSFKYPIFLFAVVILFYAFPSKGRRLFLLLASVLFYVSAKPVMIHVPAIIIFITYFCGLLMTRDVSVVVKRYIFGGGIVSIVGILVYYKYFNFVNDSITYVLAHAQLKNPIPFMNIAVPLGISYITFQSIGYLIEVYWGRQCVETNFLSLATFLAFFPKLIAGPVERAHNFLPQLKRPTVFDYDSVTDGLRLLAWGMFQKSVVADRIGNIVNQIYAHPQGFPGLTLLIGAFFFVLQVYADFSGYTDMARGSAALMGFSLMKNFDRPLFSRSTTELWRRWHISLSTWFSDYVFTPISVSRRSWEKWGMVFASIVTFLILGLWHGARWGFVIFGLLQGIALSVEILAAKKSKKVLRLLPAILSNICGVCCTLLFFSLALVFIRASSVSDAWYILTHIPVKIQEVLFHWVSIEHTLKIDFDTNEWIVVACGLVFMESINYLQVRQGILLKKTHVCLRWAVYLVVLYGIIIFGINKWDQFIYFKF